MQKNEKVMCGGLAALCLAGSMSCFTMAEASENVQEQAQDQMLYSSRMWESNGHIYTVYNVDAEGYTSLSGNYMDAIAVYEGKVYWRKNNGEENEPAEIIRMEPDGSGQEVLAENAHPSSLLCIDEGFIYYTASDEKGRAKKSRRINLDTGEKSGGSAIQIQSGKMKTSGFPHLWKTGYGIARSPDIKISGQCQG